MKDKRNFVVASSFFKFKLFCLNKGISYLEPDTKWVHRPDQLMGYSAATIRIYVTSSIWEMVDVKKWAKELFFCKYGKKINVIFPPNLEKELARLGQEKKKRKGKASGE